MNVPFAEVGYFEPWWMQILKALVIFAVGLQLVPIVLIVERKLIGRFQNRYGPNRVGPVGLVQPLADIVKLMFKEELRPRASDALLFALDTTGALVRRLERDPGQHEDAVLRPNPGFAYAAERAEIERSLDALSNGGGGAVSAADLYNPVLNIQLGTAWLPSVFVGSNGRSE